MPEYLGPSRVRTVSLVGGGYSSLRDLSLSVYPSQRREFLCGLIPQFGTDSTRLFLPNYPATTAWLNDEEKSYGQWRLMHDAKEADDIGSVGIWQALKMTLADKRLYLFVFLLHTSLLSQTFQYFFPTIVQTLGYGNIVTLLITAPVWVATFLVSLLVTWTSGKTNDRSLHIISLMLVTVVGCLIATLSTNKGARFFAMFL